MNAIAGEGEEERRGKERERGKGTWKGLKTMRGGYRAGTRDRKRGIILLMWRWKLLRMLR